MLLACVLLFVQANDDWQKAHDKALRLYAKGEMQKAAAAFRKALPLAKDDRAAEVTTFSHLILADLGANARDVAVEDYRALLALAPDFRWNPDEIVPDDLSYLDAAVRKKVSAPISAAPSSAPVDAPRQVRVSPPAAEKAWRWYYLAPLGVGQFLAGSPVRGSVFLTLTVAAIAANVAGYALYSGELLPDGTAAHASKARMGQAVMNVGFFTLIAAVAAGIVDAAVFEP